MLVFPSCGLASYGEGKTSPRDRIGDVATPRLGVEPAGLCNICLLASFPLWLRAHWWWGMKHSKRTVPLLTAAETAEVPTCHPLSPPQVVSVSGSGAWTGQVWEGRLQTWKLALTLVVLWSTCWLVPVPSKACFFSCHLDPREYLIMLPRKASGSLARVDQGRLCCLKKT